MAEVEEDPNNFEKEAGEPVCNSSGCVAGLEPENPRLSTCVWHTKCHSKQATRSHNMQAMSFFGAPLNSSQGLQTPAMAFGAAPAATPQAAHSNQQALMAPVAATPIATTPIVAAITSTPKRKAINSGNLENAAKKTPSASTTMNAQCPQNSQANFLAQAAGLEATNALHVKRLWQMKEGSNSLLFQEKQNRKLVVDHEKINGRGHGTCCYLPRDSSNIWCKWQLKKEVHKLTEGTVELSKQVESLRDANEDLKTESLSSLSSLPNLSAEPAIEIPCSERCPTPSNGRNKIPLVEISSSPPTSEEDSTTEEEDAGEDATQKIVVESNNENRRDSIYLQLAKTVAQKPAAKGARCDCAIGQLEKRMDKFEAALNALEKKMDEKSEAQTNELRAIRKAVEAYVEASTSLLEIATGKRPAAPEGVDV
ncbi:uncharacterized protein TRIVIDRAFT_206891 [Trichoderma virens Gv29-8]|uniref:Uncharacterized protein n=1 Tax=Hypocrea virens (strain Gv29-8 / FGSC 10586) TaxID=413071 RepID=G9NBP6_HYPVG|nr:uncharacterized protein TRIVIDRAFT_206891 [Trichoderma virens Gv29-8]EHK16250.1 hypothetical protein TRIVIDRAFT_206891 [Trichoderma virens Gv29-8]